MPIYRETPESYRKDVALENAWHEEVWTVGLHHTMVSIKTSSTVFEVVAVVVIR